MASFTGYSGSKNYVSSSTASGGTYIGNSLSPSSGTVGYDSLALATYTTWATQTLTSPGADHVGFSANSFNPESYANNDLSPSTPTISFDVGLLGGISDTTRRTYPQSGASDAVAATIGMSENDTYIGENLSPSQHVSGMQPLSLGDTAVILPTAYLRKIRGEVVNTDGNRVTDAKYIVSLDNFGIVGRVYENGTFDMYLLNRTYESFMLVVEEGSGKNMDVVHYEALDGQEVDIYTDYATLVFDTENTIAKKPGGLSMADGISLG